MTTTTFDRAADHHAAQNREARAADAAAVTWKEVDQARFWEMLGVLPPAAQTDYGFLVGEAWRHRTCAITGRFCAAFAAFYEFGDRYFEASGPLTRAEFRAVKREDVLASALSRLASALLAQITPREDGTMPCTGLPTHLPKDYRAAVDNLLAAGLAYRYEGALFRL